MEFVDIIRGAVTQYGDATGTVAIDWYEGSAIHDLAKDYGVSAQYFPVGIGFFGTALRVTIYAVDREVAGKTAEEVMEFAERCDEENPLPVYAFKIDMSISDLSKYVKELDIMARPSKLIGHLPFGIQAVRTIGPEGTPES